MKILVLLFSLLFLVGCGDSQHAAYLVGGPQHSLTLMRQQGFIGSGWDSELIVAHVPDCQRRYPLQDAVSDKIKMDVYRTEPGIFILNSGARWYVTETQTCRFEQYKVAPPEPGDLVGSFQVKDGNLEYKGLDVKKPAADAVTTPRSGIQGTQSEPEPTSAKP